MCIEKKIFIIYCLEKSIYLNCIRVWDGCWRVDIYEYVDYMDFF